MQPQKNLLDAILYKMKADYLRYIFECLNGDDGLLKNDEKFRHGDKILTRTPERFDDDTEEREKREINKDEKSKHVNLVYPPYKKGDKVIANDKQEMTLIEYFRNEVYFEYERAKLEIFDKDYNP